MGVGGGGYDGAVQQYDALSRCSRGEAIEFRWYGFAQPTAADLDAATERFVQAISGGTRRWNPYALGMARREFRDRLQQAAAGRLKPVDEVKPVDIDNPPPLYEIRWQDIPVTDADDDAPGGKRFGTILVRLYHSEPVEAPGYFIGHHIHEKLTSGDINRGQDQEIAVAKGYYDAGVHVHWGIMELLG